VDRAASETGVAHNIVNVPLSRGCGSELFRERIESGMLQSDTIDLISLN